MDPYLGEIRIVGFNYAPQGWALCNGQTLSIAQNTALFALLGTFYGGDGVTTFNLPNLQGRVPIHQGAGSGLSPYNIGQIGGAERVTLTTPNLPSHTHGVTAQATEPTVPGPSGAFLAGGGRGATTNLYATSTGNNATMNPGMIQTTGSNQPVATLPPYLCLNFIIALQGIFPPRN
jgi:microcystin-dependent protein